MDVREKLVELLHKGVRCPGVIDNCNDCPHHSLEKPCDEFGATVDMLIANGVTVQELDFLEQDYYVLRNTETGMYFRGKGVNRWGKYFNQATIYRVKGTAEHSIKEVSWHGEKAELVRIKIVEMPQPPKGE